MKLIPENKNYYRPDIDGLRAVAVILVILYHLFPGIFKNGFLGVDIFFVISGFVVTQSLQASLVSGYFKGGLSFYSRRIKRILPALYVNIIISLILSCLLIPFSELRSLFKTAAAALVGASNVALLYARFDYFSPDLSLNPFVHTWSLGVEEQFYFVFPLILTAGLFIASVRAKIKVDILIGLCALLSLGYWIYLLFHAGVSAFYNPLARFWELFTGVLLFRNKDAIAASIGRKINIILQYAACLCLIVALFFSFNAGPGNLLNYVLVVLGTAFFIIAGFSSSPLNKTIGSGPFVKAGLMSYSLYLWHYPVFVLMRWNFNLEHFLPVVVACFLFISAAYLSYTYIEMPCRHASVKGGKVVLMGMAGGLVCLVLVYALYELPPSRLYLGNVSQYYNLWPKENEPLTPSLKTPQRSCHLEYRDALSPNLLERCSTVEKNEKFIYLIGNSHAQHLVPMLEAVSQKTGYGYSALTISNCRLISAFQMVGGINYRYDLCKDYFDYVLDSVIKNSKPGDIVLIGARSLFEKPSSLEGGNPSRIYLENGRELSSKEVYEKTMSDLSAFVSAVNLKGVSVVFTGPTPSFGLSAAQCAPEWFRSDNESCRASKKLLVQEQETELKTLSELMEKNKNVYFWDPSLNLCPDDFCYPVADGKLLFRDLHHLSFWGSQSLAPEFIEFIQRLKL
ncbi:acyltransferase [bacterium]|nr:acyltransferase [bacterium]